MLDFLKNLKKESNLTFTDNGALTNKSSLSACLDLFFRAGNMRTADNKEIFYAVKKAYAEDPLRTLKIVFYARDIRGGLGEREFFRKALKALSAIDKDAVNRNLQFVSEYGRYDDLFVLMDTNCMDNMMSEITSQLAQDISNMNKNKPVSLLAKWLPSVNASSKNTIALANKFISHMQISPRKYRQTLSALRKYIDITENYIRTRDYSFDYSKQPSGAMFKYRKAFMLNDEERYKQYLEDVQSGKSTLHASTLFPYQIVRRCLDIRLISDDELSLDTTWKSLSSHGDNHKNAIAVVDCSGSMYCEPKNQARPVDVAFSLGIYFAEHSKGVFADHFITFSKNARLLEIKGKNIAEKVRYCNSFSEIANTDIEAVFELILRTAVKNHSPQEELPETIYIISDLEFDCCVTNGNNDTVFRTMQKKYQKFGYKLPSVVFWNVAGRSKENIPVTANEQGTALVSGFSPVLFDMAINGDISPLKLMD
nr:DUF2828 family protein [Ruminococcus sp.]